MCVCGRVEVCLHSFRTSAADGGNQRLSPAHLSLGKELVVGTEEGLFGESRSVVPAENRTTYPWSSRS